MQELYIDDVIEKAHDLEKQKKYKKKIFTERLLALMPKKGHIVLSGKRGDIIIYDQKSQSYRKALFDIEDGNPIAGNQLFEIEDYKPSIPITNEYLMDELTTAKEAANFICFLIGLHDKYKSPVIEFGRRANRYFPIKAYSQRTDRIPTIE